MAYTSTNDYPTRFSAKSMSRALKILIIALFIIFVGGIVTTFILISRRPDKPIVVNDQTPTPTATAYPASPTPTPTKTPVPLTTPTPQLSKPADKNHARTHFFKTVWITTTTTTTNTAGSTAAWARAGVDANGNTYAEAYAQ